MIPLYLTISGFLSYHEPVELDLSSIELACIAGPNGAGKSSLLDAITWVLFGQARKRDESLINTRSSAAEVCLYFIYENNIYRVQRTLPRGKTNVLEFHILQDPHQWARTDRLDSITIHQLIQAPWKPLTERTLRETQARIEATLSLDYETFVNASFFLQGKADQFTQQRPGDRKRILSSILGLEVWESYRQRCVDRRKVVEQDVAALDGRLMEIKSELAEEEDRKKRLQELERELSRLSKTRETQEKALEVIRRNAAVLEEQEKRLAELIRQVDQAARRLSEAQERLEARLSDQGAYSKVITRAAEIQAGYNAWQQARLELERWEDIAAQFREQEKARQGPLTEIEKARVLLTQELQVLERQKTQLEAAQAEAEALQTQLSTVQQACKHAEELLKRRDSLDKELQEARQRQADARAENPRLRQEMDELKARIDQLSQAEGAVCPLCGQPLSPQERKNLIESLGAQGKELGDRYRANKALLEQADQYVRSLEDQILSLSQAETDLRTYTRTLDQITSRLEAIRNATIEWETQGAPRLAEVRHLLETETFASEARQALAQIDEELKAIGYDASAHDAARQAEQSGRHWETELRNLEKAQAALVPLEREIAELRELVSNQTDELSRLREAHDLEARALAEAQAKAPDVEEAERQLESLLEQENRLRMDVGAAQQKVHVLIELKHRRKELEAEREEKVRLIGHYKQLERAFSKDGVPSLLIEQALPQIEAKSNEILERLTGGTMTVRFVTQAAYKDKKRDDLRETLEIQISDGMGTRDYDLFSGGEGFRVNFAVRLALSEVLAKRAGARLQTLVIDEGFGSQDALGRQRLIEAINLVRQDFSKILVITHIDELKDAFPRRIEVEKTPQGSMVRVV